MINVHNFQLLKFTISSYFKRFKISLSFDSEITRQQLSKYNSSFLVLSVARARDQRNLFYSRFRVPWPPDTLLLFFSKGSFTPDEKIVTL